MGETSTTQNRKPRLYFWIQVLLTIGLVTLVFGGLELVIRFRESREFGPGSLHSIALRDRFTAWRNNPAYSRVDRKINPQGFRRDDEVSLEKPPDTVRIFLTGGSVAYGWTTGWPDVETHLSRLYGNETISSYVEEKLNRTHPSRRWEVINAAVVGYQLNLELAQTQAVLLRYHPDAIIYLDGHNDLLSLLRRPGGTYDPYASTPTGAEFELLANPGSFRSLFFFGTVWLRENSALFRKMVERIQPTEEPPAAAASGASAPGARIRPFDLTPQEQQAFDAMKRQISFYPRLARQIHRTVDLDGAKAIFLLQPELLLTHKPLTATERRLLDRARNNSALYLYSFQELYPQLAASMASAAQQDGFSFLDLTGSFDTTPGQMFTDDCHLTPEANRLVAQRVFDLVESALLPESPRGEGNRK